MTSIETKKQESSLTKEELDFLRIAYLILRVSAPAVRVIFDREFYPGGLQATLNQAKVKPLTGLKTKKRINQSQWDVMFPSSGKGPVSSTNFDLTLMICLIRNLTNISVGDQLPPITDVSEGADLSRLKYYRNRVAHSNYGILTEIEFHEYWTTICQAIVRLGGNSFRQKCDDLHICKLDINDRKELTDWLKRIHMEEIKEWEKQNVVETRAIKHLTHLVKKVNAVLAVGSSGCGKSTSIQYIATMLRQQEGFEIIPINTPELILQCYNDKCRQVFVINDICGKSTIDIHLVNTWAKIELEILKMLKSKTVKILASCRTYIYQDRLFKNIAFMANAVCNLTSEFSLTKLERISIAEIFLTKEELTKIQANIVEKYDFFPLLCNLFTKQTERDVVAFFSNPVTVIQNDLKLMMNSNDQTSFAVLFLFIVYSNNLDDTLLLNTSGIKKVLDHLSEKTFIIRSYLSIKVVKTELDKLSETFIKKIDDTFSFSHDKLFDIFVSFCGEHMFDLVLDMAHRDVVRDRFVLKGLISEDDDSNSHLIIIPYSKVQTYFERLLKDVNDGFIKHIFLNKQLKYETFRKELIEFLEGKDIHNSTSKLCYSTCDMLYFAMVRQGFCDMLRLLISKNVHFSLNFTTSPMGCTLLHEASEYGFVDIVMTLVKRNANPNIMSKTLETSLFVASEKGYNEIVHLLLHHKADPNLECRRKITPLYVASLKGYASIVKLLLRYNADPNTCSWGNVTPLFEASRNGHIDVVKVLLKYHADPNLRDKYNRIPLDIAVDNGYTNIVSILLEYKSEINHRDDDIATPLLRALTAKNTETAMILLEYGADCNISNADNITPLVIAVENDQTEILDAMFKLETKVNSEQRCNAIRLHISCKTGNIKELKSSFERRVDLDSIDHEFNQSVLHLACSLGNIEIVKILLAQNCKINICDKNDTTPLHISSSLGQTDFVQLLLDHKAKINVKDKLGRTPLFKATISGHSEIVKLLLKYKCDVNISIYWCNLTPLISASLLGYTNIAKLIIEHVVHTNDINIYDSDKETPLFGASRNGHTDIVHLLLHHHCDPYICNKDEDTPLLIACSNGNIQVVKLLLQYVYSKKHNYTFVNDSSEITPFNYIDKPNKYGITPLFAAVQSNCDADIDIVKLLLNYKADHYTFAFNMFGPLFHASIYGNSDMMNVLLNHNADPNMVTKENITPIHLAAMNNHTEIVKLLLKYNCNPNGYDEDNTTPLSRAAENGNVEIVTLLLEQKCNPHVYDKWHSTPLFHAVKNGHIEVVKLLLKESNNDTNVSNNKNNTNPMKLLSKQNCDINFLNGKQETALFRASCNGNAEIVNLLLENKSDPNITCITNNRNTSPLCIASFNGHFEVVKSLIDHKCDINQYDDVHETPLFKALYQGHTDISELLLHHDCDPNIFNEITNITPLYIASNMGYTKIVKLILDHCCEIEVCDQTARSPLYGAAYNGYTEIVKLILNHKYVHKIRMNTRVLASKAAEYNGHQNIVMLLMQNNM